MTKEQEIVLNEYSFIAISGNRYHPVFKDRKWYIINTIYHLSLLDIAQLCQIPEDEVLILKLKYGG
jgi:hypothetical protein